MVRIHFNRKCCVTYNSKNGKWLHCMKRSHSLNHCHIRCTFKRSANICKFFFYFFQPMNRWISDGLMKRQKIQIKWNKWDEKRKITMYCCVRLHRIALKNDSSSILASFLFRFQHSTRWRFLIVQKRTSYIGWDEWIKRIQKFQSRLAVCPWTALDTNISLNNCYSFILYRFITRIRKKYPQPWPIFLAVSSRLHLEK